MTVPKIKYLTNKDLLKEIHLSKNTYCSYIKPEYGFYDLIVPNLAKINIRTIAEAKRNCAIRLSKQAHEAAVIAGGKKLPAKEFEVDYKKMRKEDLIFRVMTFEHIPLAPGRKKTLKNTADSHDNIGSLMTKATSAVWARATGKAILSAENSLRITVR